MDNHAISLAFDNLNNAYEAEMERDEKQQQQELAALLQQEFDDFDYDDDDDEEEEEEEEEEQDGVEEEEGQEVEEEKSAHRDQLERMQNDTALGRSVGMDSLCTESDGEEEEEEEEEEDDGDDEEEAEDAEMDHVKSRLSLTPCPSVRELMPRPRDWSTPMPVSSLPDADMQPREKTPAAMDPPDPPHTVFPPGPPSTDTSEVFGPRASSARLHPSPFETAATVQRASNPSSFLTGRMSSLSSHHQPPRTTRDIGVEAIPVGQRELDQLEILYQARGRRIEELQSEVLRMKEEQARELRVLKHRLSLAEGERNGARISHQEAQRHLVSTKEELERLKSEMRVQHQAMEELTTERAELSERLKNAEMTVEAMNGQLVEMNTSEALRRAKEQQNNVMASLKLKYDREVVELRETVDLTRRDLEAREDALRETRARADLLEREKREQATDHAENVSRMVKQLDDLQSRYRETMCSVSADEVKKLKAEIEELTARKNITDSVNRALQDEAKELKEQLSMYENAHRLGLGGSVTSSPAPHTEVSSDVSIRSLPANPHSPSQSHIAVSPVSTTASLKRELERCLVNYRAKRQQAADLQEQLFEMKKERQELRLKLEKSETNNRETHQRLASVQTEVEDLRVKCSGQNPEMLQLRRELEKLKREKELSEEGRLEAQKRMEEVLASEGRLSELNEELQRQISQIFRDFDADKRESLDRVQQTWEQHLEQSKTSLRDELTREFGSERIRLVTECDARVNAAEAKLKRVDDELDRVKNEFVALAELRSQEADETKNRWQREEEERRAKMLEEAMKSWKQEEEERMQTLLNELEEEKKNAIDHTRRATENRVKAAMEAELEERLQRAEEDWKKDKDTEVQSRLELQREELEGERERQVEETRLHLNEEFNHRLSSGEKEWQQRMEEIRLKCQAAEKLRDTLSAELVRVRSDQQSELNLASSLEQRRWTELETELRRQMEDLEAERDRALMDGQKEQREREAIELELRRRVDTLEAALTEARHPTSPAPGGERLRLATLEAALAEECRRSRENLQRQQSRAEETETALRRRVEELEAAQSVDSHERMKEIKKLEETETQLRRRVEELEAGQDMDSQERMREVKVLRLRVEELEAEQKIDWEQRVKDMKRRLEKEFRTRFHDYRTKRDAEMADVQYRLDRERLLRVTRWQDSRHCGCQTDSSEASSDSAVVTRMREQFVESLSRIRGEVLAHVSMSRTRAALALQTELGRSQHRACRRLAENFRTAVTSLENISVDNDSVSRKEVIHALDLCLSLSRSAVNSSSSSSDINTPRSCSYLFPPSSDRTSDQSFLSGISLPVVSVYEPLKAFRRVSTLSKSAEEKENWSPSFETRRST